MALPTFWELLLPSLSWTTILGGIMIVVSLFNNLILTLFGKIVKFFTGGRINTTTIRVSLLGIGIVLVWLPSIIQDFWKTTEGKLVLVAFVTFVIMVLILVNTFSKKDGKKEF